MRKRTNKQHLDTYLIGKDDQALATGQMTSTTNALNIADGQLGVLTKDIDGTVAIQNFIPAATTAANVKSIQVVQGTPKSANTTSINNFGLGDQGLMPGSPGQGIIDRDKIMTVSTQKCELPSYGVRRATGFNTTVLPDTEYKAYAILDSVKGDKYFGKNDDANFASFTTGDLVAVTDNLHWLLSNIAYRLNGWSKAVQQSQPTTYSGNKAFVMLAINEGAGAGVAIGTVAVGTVIPFQTDGTNVNSLVADVTLVNTLNKVIAGGLAATATIEVIDLTAALTGTGIDELLIMGLDNDEAEAFDNVYSTKVDADLQLGAQFVYDTTIVKTQVSTPSDPVSSYKNLKIDLDNNAKLRSFSLENHPHGEYFPEAVDYLVKDQDYTITIIEFYGEEETQVLDTKHQKNVKILLPCGITNIAATAAVGYTVATTDTTTVAGLNATLGAWLDSANAYSGFAYKGEATSGAIFV